MLKHPFVTPGLFVVCVFLLSKWLFLFGAGVSALPRATHQPITSCFHVQRTIGCAENIKRSFTHWFCNFCMFCSDRSGLLAIAEEASQHGPLRARVGRRQPLRVTASLMALQCLGALGIGAENGRSTMTKMHWKKM